MFKNIIFLMIILLLFMFLQYYKIKNKEGFSVRYALEVDEKNNDTTYPAFTEYCKTSKTPGSQNYEVCSNVCKDAFDGKTPKRYNACMKLYYENDNDAYNTDVENNDTEYTRFTEYCNLNKLDNDCVNVCTKTFEIGPSSLNGSCIKSLLSRDGSSEYNTDVENNDTTYPTFTEYCKKNPDDFFCGNVCKKAVEIGESPLTNACYNIYFEGYNANTTAPNITTPMGTTPPPNITTRPSTTTPPTNITTRPSTTTPPPSTIMVLPTFSSLNCTIFC